MPSTPSMTMVSLGSLAIGMATQAGLPGARRPREAGVVLATNMSYLDVNAIAEITQRPQDILGMRFFSPANVMKLCEIVRAAGTTQFAVCSRPRARDEPRA